MNGSNFMKLLALILGLALLNIIVLSPGLVGVEIGGDSTLQTAAGITLLVVSVIVLLYGSYSLLFRAPVAPPIRNIQSHEDFVEALSYYRNVRGLKKHIHLALDQLERIVKRKSTLEAILTQRFEPTELSYKKFASVIAEVEKLFYLNTRSVLNKLNVFDISEFAAFAAHQHSAQFSNRLVQEKMNLYSEYMKLITGYLGANEEIILKLDKLVLEISRLGSASYADVEEMPCMKEIDALIKQTKYYK